MAGWQASGVGNLGGCCSLGVGNFQLNCAARTSQQSAVVPWQELTSSLCASTSVNSAPLFSRKGIGDCCGSSQRYTGGSATLWQQSTSHLQSSGRKLFGPLGHQSIGRQGDLGKGTRRVWNLQAGLKETELTEQQWGPPIRLGTAQLPNDVDLAKLQNLLYQWGSSLTQNANLPLPMPLKVDKVEGGVRLGYIKVSDGKVEDIVHIDVLVIPAKDGSKAMFQAIRNGKMKNSVPPGEPMIMQSLLAALKRAVSMARP